MIRSSIEHGDLWLAALDPVVAHEQGGTRPILVVSAAEFHAWPIQMLFAVPITSRDRGLPHHVPVGSNDLPLPSFAMPEYARSISQRRLVRRLGRADDATLAAVNGWLRRITGGTALP
ncbi:MAG: type II toxin-antitoxin system PemK/MazF family toxin [Micrococcales bacterium]|nr:type II toxin-antitoxin system PemK/MazF family toxin [Micrococcales bacterium]